MRYLIAVLLAGAAFAQNPNTAIFPGSAPNPPVASIKAASTLASGMDATQTTATLVSGTAYRIPGVFTIELERIYCTGKTGNQLTSCTRGFDGTTGATHTSGKTVSGYISSWGWNQVAAELAAVAAGDFGGRTVKGAGFEAPAGTALEFGGACKAAASVTTPAAGEYAFFLDSGNSCHLSRMDSARAVVDMQTGTSAPAGWVAPPASTSSTGTQGQYSGDATYGYMAIATDTWKRVAWDATWAEAVATPTFSPTAGAVSNPTTVTISSTTPSAVICHTEGNGSQAAPTAPTPGTCATGTTGATVSVTGATTIKALGTKAGMTNSAEASAAYTISGGATITHIQDRSGGSDPNALCTTPCTVDAATASPSYSIGNFVYGRVSIRNACADGTLAVSDNGTAGGNTYTQIASAFDNATLTCQSDFWAILNKAATVITATVTGAGSNPIRMPSISVGEWSGVTSYGVTGTAATTGAANLTTGSLSLSAGLIIAGYNNYAGDVTVPTITGPTCTWTYRTGLDPYGTRGYFSWCVLAAPYTGTVTHSNAESIASVRVSSFQ